MHSCFISEKLWSGLENFVFDWLINADRWVFYLWPVFSLLLSMVNLIHCTCIQDYGYDHNFFVISYLLLCSNWSMCIQITSNTENSFKLSWQNIWFTCLFLVNVFFYNLLCLWKLLHTVCWDQMIGEWQMEFNWCFFSFQYYFHAYSL